MRVKQKRLFWLACLAVGALLLISFVRSREPRYQGRSLTDWLIQAEQSNNKPAEFDAARNAVLAIGTNAIPYLLKWTEYPKPSIGSHFRALLEKARNYSLGRRAIPEALTLDWRFERFLVASRGFSILGGRAAPAAPELHRKLLTAPDWLTAKACLDDLQAIAPDIHRLCAIITNAPPKGWSIPPSASITPQADMSIQVIAMDYLIRIGTNAAAAVPALGEAIRSEDMAVALHAVLTLGLIGGGQAVTVPSLTQALEDPRAPIRAQAADSLQRLGSAAMPAVPALVKNLADEDKKVREWTTNALVEIAPQVLSNPVK